MTKKPLIGTAIAVVGSFTLAAALAGCTSGAAPGDAALADWMAKTQTSVWDRDGGGGAGGVVPGNVQLGSVPTGEYTVWATCDGADTVSIVVDSGGETLAEAEVGCGTTLSVPIETTSTDVQFTVSSDSATGYWAVYLNRPDWSPGA